jgi:tryptophanyl-tRNA synthetase
MARTMQRRFNQQYGNLFPEPQPLEEQAVRIPSLTGQGKMSKSDTSSSYISMKDERELVEGKVKKAYSDPSRAYRDQPGTPTIEGCNVYHLHTFFSSNETNENIMNKCRSAAIGCVQCKAELAQSMNALVQPFRARREQLSDSYIHDVLLAGKQQAQASARQVIAEVREAMNLIML